MPCRLVLVQVIRTEASASHRRYILRATILQLWMTSYQRLTDWFFNLLNNGDKGKQLQAEYDEEARRQAFCRTLLNPQSSWMEWEELNQEKNDSAGPEMMTGHQQLQENKKERKLRRMEEMRKISGQVESQSVH